MNIGPLLRSMMGDVRSGEAKSLELKTGQVVRGTVLSVSDDGQVAVIQVQGVKLHAALETPMRPGETTLLQVQPESKDGLAVLKPISADPGTVLSPASLAKALESLGLENSPANREFLQMMQKNGIPLTRENFALLQKVSGLKPAGVPLSEWIQAAGIAFGRGLPITGETVAGLHQAVFGPPLHVLLSSLEEQIASFLRQLGPEMTGNGGQPRSGPAAAGSSAQTGQSASPLPAGDTAAPASSGANAGTAAGGAAQPGALPNGGGAPPNQAAGLMQLARQGAYAVGSDGPPSPQPGLQGQHAASAPGGALVAKLQAVLAELQSSVLPEGTDLPGRASAGPARGAAAEGQSPAADAPQGEGPAGPSPAGTRPTLAAEPWVGRVLKLLGAEHEQQALRATAPAASPAAGAQEAPPAAPGEAELPPGKAQPLGAEAAATAAAARSGGNVTAASTAAHETLKGLLLQVMASDELPAPLQEAARQLVQQLTGQQLLLNTDRTAPFAHVTMFLPLIGPDGRQTAAVHIESRRGRKGELDPANCRLWFDLQMKTLGQLMVDVQVADKKVLLKIYSEKEATGAFLESRQDEVSEALEKAGYRLLSLKAEPLIPPVEAEGGNAADFSQPMSYAPSVYKGVDYRV
ncbi:flagellar hook-length control protein FliK [Paenibacillus barengoltzii]|uniref:Flagellar hook-length control protein FliK n=1 Tax=Paenibacillus barengoltzii J12 TaxID=935846 RepID=A0ABY1LZN9_9BACL|nr:flagellar hook-length control protein FliK [Paenibacillus barengoltzii]SMF21369.1 hypothetical protein SAMN02744124_01865 [Paenibacillus barengoltzii J12]